MDRPTDSRIVLQPCIEFLCPSPFTSLTFARRLPDLRLKLSPTSILTGSPPHSGSDSIRQSLPDLRQILRIYIRKVSIRSVLLRFRPFHPRKGYINLLWREHFSKSLPTSLSASRLFSLGTFRRPAVTTTHCYPRLSTCSKQIALLINQGTLPLPYSNRILKPSTCLAEVSVLSSTTRST